ncbi:Transient receptor potential cation channel subfamily M member 2, partial [Lamellibrachia satsuma]
MCLRNSKTCEPRKNEVFERCKFWQRDQREGEPIAIGIDHQHPPRKCPAYGATCSKCKGRNHFAKVCKGGGFRKKIYQLETDHTDDHDGGSDYLFVGSMECEATNSSLSRCPENTAFVPTVLQAGYILITSVLMLNLLIAKFSYTFQKIQDNSHQVWCSQRYSAIKEYHDRPPVVPPLNILYHIIQGIRYVIRRCMNKTNNTNEENSNPFRRSYSKHDEYELKMWERLRANEYVRQLQNDQRQSLENMVKETRDRMDAMEKQ